MTLKYLSVDEMLSITASWVDPSHADRSALGRMISIGGLLPLVEEAHRELGTAYRKGPKKPSADMTAELLAADLEHDSYVRVTWHALEATIQLRVAKMEERSELESLRNRLLPDGLSLVDYSYTDESTQARQLEHRLGPEDKAILASIPIQDGTLLDAVNAWIKAGKELGQLQTERELMRTRNRRVDQMDQARRKWIQAVNTVRMVLKLMDDDQPAIKAIIEKMERLEGAAENRMRDSIARS